MPLLGLEPPSSCQPRIIKNDTSVRGMMKVLGLDEYINREGVTEVIINRPNEVFLETAKGFERIEDERLSFEKLTFLANMLAVFNNKAINAQSPMHSVTLPDGERGHIMLPPTCEKHTLAFAFRKPSSKWISFDACKKTKRLANFNYVSTHCKTKASATDVEINGKSFSNICDKMQLPNDVPLANWQLEMLNHIADRNLNDFFALAINHKLNICMVGGTGSGKTTFTKALTDFIPSDTRILTIEDTHELNLPNHPNHAHLFHSDKFPAKEIIASCMRLKPDRIFLTELRGDEAWDYLSALNTGHQGGLTSVHANDARSVYYRIAQLAKESSTGKTLDFDYILNTVKATIDVVCFFNKTFMTELYFDPVDKFYAMSGRK